MATSEEEPITQQQPEEAATQAESGAGESQDLIELFSSTISEYEATFVVYYRGNW